MEINYHESWVYSADLTNETITFYIEEISYKEMMEVMARYVGYRLILRPQIPTYTPTIVQDQMPKDLISTCPCSTENGGSGVCGCILPNQTIS